MSFLKNIVGKISGFLSKASNVIGKVNHGYNQMKGVAGKIKTLPHVGAHISNFYETNPYARKFDGIQKQAHDLVSIAGGGVNKLIDVNNALGNILP